MSDEPDAPPAPEEEPTPPLALPERSNLPMIIVVGVVLVSVLIAVPAFVLLAGEKSDSDGRDATPTVINDDQVTIDISNFKFDPSNVTVPLGATVTWINLDGQAHDATDDDETWRTERLEKDIRGAITFDEPGEYDYHCSLHPYMKATLTVAGD